MSIKTLQFDAFGVLYKTTQFSAVSAAEIMSSDKIDPITIMQKTEAYRDGTWWALDSDERINYCVVDIAGALSPPYILKALMSIVNDFNFKFMEGWKGTRIPSRFREDCEVVENNNVDPMIAVLLADGVATLRELEEYYSLEDAFKMFDVLMTKSLNECLAMEAAKRG